MSSLLRPAYLARQPLLVLQFCRIDSGYEPKYQALGFVVSWVILGMLDMLHELNSTLNYVSTASTQVDECCAHILAGGID